MVEIAQANNMQALYSRIVISKDDKDASTMHHLTNAEQRSSNDDLIDVKAVLAQEHSQ